MLKEYWLRAEQKHYGIKEVMLECCPHFCNEEQLIVSDTPPDFDSLLMEIVTVINTIKRILLLYLQCLGMFVNMRT